MNKTDKLHVHKFDIPAEQPVLLHDIKGNTTAKDTLKQRKCICGAIETYDLERMKLL